MLSILSMQTFFLKSNGLRFQAVRWFGFERNGDLGGLIAHVPKSHSLWDADAGSLAEYYGYYEDTVVAPGSWVVIAYDSEHYGREQTSNMLGLAPVYDDDRIHDLAADMPIGGALERRERVLTAALRGGKLGVSQVLDRPDVGQRFLDKLECYIVSGRIGKDDA